ncbi:MAG TPA: 30S ribosome-binding factor RbfA [Candidatus Binatia bacterium]|nr:30S ribosome-binding factor RbfA [Candidatus Binatia bacterium]
MTARTDRIDQLLREEIGAILAKDVQDPRIGFVTVTEVDTAPDLSTARVWVSIIGQPAERTTALRALEHAMPFVRRELGVRLRMRRIPELYVKADETAQRGTRVLQLLAELERGGSAEDLPEPEESLPTPTPRSTIEEPPAPRPGPRRGPDGGRGARRGLGGTSQGGGGSKRRSAR